MLDSSTNKMEHRARPWCNHRLHCSQVSHHEALLKGSKTCRRCFLFRNVQRQPTNQWDEWNIFCWTRMAMSILLILLIHILWVHFDPAQRISVASKLGISCILFGYHPRITLIHPHDAWDVLAEIFRRRLDTSSWFPGFQTSCKICKVDVSKSLGPSYFHLHFCIRLQHLFPVFAHVYPCKPIKLDTKPPSLLDNTPISFG